MIKTIDFTVEDILDKYNSLKKLNPEEMQNEIGLMHHELLGSYNRVGGLVQVICMINPENVKTDISDKLMKYGSSTRKALNSLAEHYSKTIPQKQNTVRENAEIVITNIKSVYADKPIEKIIIDKTKINDETKLYLEKGDEEIDNIITKHNNSFSKNIDTKEYMLARQIIQYEQNQNRSTDILIKTNIDAELISQFDYFNKIIVPILDNIKDHAYSENNDIYSRSKEGFLKQCTISTLPFDIDKNILITIHDNGFGMTKDISDKLFEKGITSRKEKEVAPGEEKEEHGIGLHYVKGLLENNGGEISHLTYHGTGTIFKIIIPYDKREEYRTYSK